MVAPNPFDPTARRSAITLLEALATEAEVHPNVLSSLGYLSWDATNPEAGFPYFDRLARMPRGAGPAELGRAMSYNLAGRFQDALDRLEASLAIERSTAALLYRAYLQTFWLGDTVGARRTQLEVPAEVLAEDLPAAARFWTELWARDWEKALEAMRAVPRDFIDSMVLSGPTGYYRGYVLARLGKRAAAELEWRTALTVVERRLAATPDDRTVLTMKSLLLVSLGEREAAEKLWRSLRELYGDGYQSWMDHFLTMEIDTAEGAIARLERLTGFVESGGVTTAAMLRLDPYLDRLRDHPRFIALQAKLEADPRFSPQAGRETATSKADAKSVAVLAFKNVGGDPANEAIVEGIGLELISALGRVSGLTVRGNSSLSYFKGSEATAQEKGRQLDVTYLVDGSLQRAGDTVRIAANLTRAATNEIVWSSTPLARDVKNIFAVQEEMAGLIAQNLSLKLGVTSAAARREVNPEAFELYVRARQAWNLRTMQGFDRAEQLLERALRLEPNFARAHAALADVWTSRGQDQLTVGSFGARHSAEVKRIVAQAEKAVTLDPESAEAHASLGSILWVGAWNLGDAERELRRAIALNPNYASARQWLGRRLLRMGATDEALVELKLAAELDPFSHRVLDNYAFGLQCAGRYTQALEMYDRALTVQPDAPGTLSNKAWVLIFLGRGAEARALVQNSQSTIAGEVSRLMVLGRTGQKAEVEKALADPARPIGDRPIIELALGRREQALAALDPQKAISYMTDRLLYSPEFDPIRAEPRFIAFLAEIGATEGHARAQAWRAAHPAEKWEETR